MRNKFDEQLDKLNGELITMGALCERAISTAICALQDGNIALARDVFADGCLVHLECLLFLRMQQFYRTCGEFYIPPW